MSRHGDDTQRHHGQVLSRQDASLNDHVIEIDDSRAAHALLLSVQIEESEAVCVCDRDGQLAALPLISCSCRARSWSLGF